MVRELVALGRAVLAGDPDALLSALVLPVNTKDSKESLLVVIDLKSSPPELAIRTEPLDATRARRYLWIGNPSGNNPKVRATTDRLDYLLAQTLPALAEDEDLPPELAERVNRVFPEFFWVDEKAQGKDRKYAYLLDAVRLGLVRPGLLDPKTWDTIRQREPNQRAKDLAEQLRRAWELPKKGVLYTLAIDGEPLATTEAYRRYLLQTVVGEVFEDAEEGLCHACGREAPVTGSFKHFKLKFFINDKVNFAYGLDEANWPKSYALCQACYTLGLAGERYLEAHLRQRVLQRETLLVPHLGPAPIERGDLETLAEILTRTVSGIDRIASAPEILHELGEGKNLPQLSLLFIERSNSATKIDEAIMEVEPSWILTLLRAISAANQKALSRFGPAPFGDWLSGMQALLYLFPLGVEGGRPKAGPALAALKSILLRQAMETGFWVRAFLPVLRALYRKNPNLFTSKNCPDRCPEIEVVLPQMAAWLLFLREAGLLKGGEKVEAKGVTEDYREAVAELGLGEAETSLFLLGVLLARVASEQYKKSQAKPVLEKVGYQGMPLEKVKRFAVELFEKLAEYRRLDANSELVFGAAMEALAREKPHWKLSDEENAFYILLGYGYETRRILNLAAERKGGQA